MQAKIHKAASGGTELWSRSRRKGGEVAEVVLRPGDIFYFPAGAWHKVECVEDSVSINISLKSLRWADLVSSGVKHLLMQTSKWREGVRFDNVDEARVKCSELLKDLRENILQRLTSDALLQAQMCRAHERGVERAAVEESEDGAAVENGDCEFSAPELDQEEEDDDDEGSLEMTVPALRTYGGPSFGGTRVFRMLQNSNSLSPVPKCDIAYKKNPLAVLISSREVENLGRSAVSGPEDVDLVRCPLFALHVNFGTEDLQSLHKTILLPPSSGVFDAIDAVGRQSESATITWQSVTAASHVTEPRRARVLLSELCHCGLLVKAGE